MHELNIFPNILKEIYQVVNNISLVKKTIIVITYYF